MIRRRIPMDALQQGVYSILSEKQTTPVYDSIPSGAAMPYIALGAFTGKPKANKTVDFSRCTVQIHIWSAYSGKTEVNEIMNDISAVLTSWPIDLSAQNFNVMDQDIEMCEAFETEENGYHGVVTFVAEIQNLGGL